VDVKWLLVLAACSGSKSRPEDARHSAHEAPRDAAAAIDAPATGDGDVQIRVEWKDTPVVARTSPGRTACGTAKVASVAPTVTWGVPDVFVMLDLPGKARSVDARVRLQDCELSPRIAIAGSELTLESGALTPAKLSLHQVGKLPFGGDLTDAARTVYLPIAGHEVVATLEPGALYRVDSDDSTAWIVAADRPFFSITEANGQVILRDVPVGPHAVTAWLPPRGNQPARIAHGTVTVVAGGLADITLDLSK
jgi:hypothetical protein